MYQSLFGAGSGAGAFATDMLILEDIENENKKHNGSDTDIEMEGDE